MCVILYKPAGAEMPDRGTIAACFAANPDGAGFMLPDGHGNVRWRKGLMDVGSLIAALGEEGAAKEKPLVIHFRITTQGGVQPGLTHPFPVCGSIARMRELSGTCRLAMAHNGVIWNCSDSKARDRSDTMEFVRRFAFPATRGEAGWRSVPGLKALLSCRETTGGNSRFAYMGGDGIVVLLGKFHARGGCYYSNLSPFPAPRPNRDPGPEEIEEWARLF